jgi:methionine-rich copper-binding protein CopC
MTGRRFGRAVAAVVLLVGVTAVGATAPAAAHSSQIGSSPATDATVASVPREVSVEFDTPLLDVGAAMVVRTGERTVSVDAPTVNRRSISIALQPDAPAGDYIVAYRVVSEDGHTIESTFAFTVAGSTPETTPSQTAAPETTPSVVASTESAPTSDPPYLLIGLGIAALLALVIGALALSR